MGSDDELVGLCLAGDEAAALDRAAKLVEAGEGNAIYSSSKAGIARWMRRNAAEPQWAGAGIPLNAIGPGIVVTPMTAELVSTEESRQAMASVVPMPLNGYMPAEAPALLHAWLVGAENTHLCGQLVFVDGGSDVVLRGELAW